MAIVAIVILLSGFFMIIGSFIWLVFRGIKDGALPSDPLLFLTGVSLIAHLFTRWARVWPPFATMLAGFLAIFVAIIVGRSS